MNKDGCLPKFFKVFLPGESGDDLKLPISFNSYIPNDLPENVIVKSIYGNVWKFELRRCCVGNIERFVMVNGWKSIVKDEDLTGGEFLVFEFDGSRFFNFCIYGHTTCKRLGSLVQTKEMEDESDDENDKSTDDIIVISDDQEHGLDVNNGQEYGDEDKTIDNIIVLSDDDDEGDNDDQNYGEEDKSSEDVNDVQDYGDQDKASDKIIILSDGDDDDQDYGSDDDDLLVRKGESG